MTTHEPIKHSDRTALPRALLGRRRFTNPDYDMTFQIGQPVTLKCTDEAAYVVGRIQIVGCLDEYLIRIIGADCDAMRVFEQDIE